MTFPNRFNIGNLFFASALGVEGKACLFSEALLMLPSSFFDCYKNFTVLTPGGCVMQLILNSRLHWSRGYPQKHIHFCWSKWSKYVHLGTLYDEGS